jgi:putative tributyrin esterase
MKPDPIVKRKRRRERASRASVFVLLLTFGGCHDKTVPAEPDRPRLAEGVVMHDYTLHSAALGRDMPYRVVAPANTSAGAKLPVVYLLHGGGADFREWTNDSDVAQFAARGIVLVMPEGDSSYYVNAATRPEDRYEDYITKDLIAEAESRLPVATGREHRAIAGVSMGGYGAVILGLKHPELFAFVGGLSPALDVPSRPFSVRRIEQWRRFRAIFGPWDEERQHENDPFVVMQVADPSQAPFFFLTCGEREGLLGPDRRFANELQSRHFPFEFRTTPGDHDWNQWNGWLRAMFDSVAQDVR